tara:strand:- start:69419 stop:70042 length:624 start_codon:yes stop_codon:yes gene_type:complete
MADINKLKSILANAKNLMRESDGLVSQNGVVTQRTSPTPSGNSNRLQDDDIQYLNEEEMMRANPGQQMGQVQPTQNPTRKPGEITNEAYSNSRLPDVIKNAMINNPIPQVSLANSSFSIEDMGDLIDQPQQVQPQRVQPQQQYAPINEGGIINTTTTSIDEGKLRSMIKTILIEYLTTDYSKNLTENAIKKTINTLIKEGKIRTKRK